MNIQPLFEDKNDVSFESYLNIKGVKDIENYVNPSGKYIESPLLFVGMKEAVQEFKYHYLMEDSLVFIIVDSDLDGYCSATTLFKYMKKLRPDWNIKLIVHTGKQRGLDDKAVMNRIKIDKPSLVIVPDAGTNNKNQAKKLTELGIGLIVLDHHDIEDDKVINDGYLITNQLGEVDKMGSGCAVTFQFTRALDIEFNVKYAYESIDIVALSTISDSMNVTSMQNREYLYWGMFKNGVSNSFLTALFSKFIGEDKEYTQRDISFKIVPKFNAVVRTKDMELKQRVLKAMLGFDDIEEVSTLCEKAHKNQIETVSKIGKYFEDKITDNEIDIEDNVIIFVDEDDMIPDGYNGLIAGKLSNIVDGKPCIVGSDNGNKTLITSLRSPIPLKDILSKSEYVDWASGHDYACGVGIRKCNVGNLREYLNSLNLSYTPHTEVLMSLSVNSIPNRFYTEFGEYSELWGHGLEKPIFHIKPFTINTKDISILGKTKRTLKIVSDNGIEFMIFMCTNKQKEALFLLDENEKNHKLSFECIGELGVNEFRGKIKPQIIVSEFEVNELSTTKTIEGFF